PGEPDVWLNGLSPRAAPDACPRAERGDECRLVNWQGTSMRARVTVWGLMLFVGVMGVILAVFRLNPGLGLLASAVCCLAFLRTAEKISRMDRSAPPMGRLETFERLVQSIVPASIVVLVAWSFMFLAPFFLTLVSHPTSEQTMFAMIV